MTPTERRPFSSPPGRYVGTVEIVKHEGGLALSAITLRSLKDGELVRPSTRFAPQNLEAFVKGKPVGWRGPAVLTRKSARQSFVFGATPGLRSALQREDELRRSIRADVDKLFDGLPPI